MKGEVLLSPPLERDIFKLVLFGYYATGKTSIFSRFTNNFFFSQYNMTTQIAQASKLFYLNDNNPLKIHLTDTLGSGFSKHMYETSLPQSHAILLVYDTTNEETFYRLGKWLEQIKLTISSQTLVVLIGTHLDQPIKKRVSKETAQKWKKNNGIDIFMEVSSKTNQNIPQLFCEIGKELIRRHHHHYGKYGKITNQMSFYMDQKESTASLKSKIKILEKKLHFKQKECQNLWISYEQALNKALEYEQRVAQGDYERSVMFSSQRDTDCGSEQWQSKVRSLEENIKTMQNYYNSKQSAQQQSYSKKIIQLKRINEQIITESQKNKQQIKFLQQLAAKVSLENEEKTKYLSVAEDQINDLENKIKKALQKTEQITDKLGFLKNKCEDFDDLLLDDNQKRELIEQLMQVDYLSKLSVQKIKQLDDQIRKNLLKIEELNEELNTVCRINTQKSDLIRIYEQKITFLQSQYLIKQQLQCELQNKNKEIKQLILHSQTKQNELIQNIVLKQEIIKQLNHKNQQLSQKLCFLKKSYDNLYLQIQKKDNLLQKKEDIISRIIHQKTSQVNKLKKIVKNQNQNQQIHNSNIQVQYLQYKRNSQKVVNVLIGKIHIQTCNFLNKLSTLHTNYQSGIEQLQIIKNKMDQFDAADILYAIKQQMIQINNQLLETVSLKQSKFFANPQQMQQQPQQQLLVQQSGQSIQKLLQIWMHSFWKIANNILGAIVTQTVISLTKSIQLVTQNTQQFSASLAQIQQGINLLQNFNQIGLQNYMQSTI